ECHLLAAVAVVAVWMGSERRARRSLEVLAGMALVVLPWLAIAWRWFHTLLPNTAAAKAGARLGPGLMIAAVHSVFQFELAADALQNAAFTALESAPNTRAHTRGLRASLASIGVWARDHTPPTASFAAADIGAFGYYSERRVLDLYGLVTPVMAPIVVREGYD